MYTKVIWYDGNKQAHMFYIVTGDTLRDVKRKVSTAAANIGKTAYDTYLEKVSRVNIRNMSGHDSPLNR